MRPVKGPEMVSFLRVGEPRLSLDNPIADVHVPISKLLRFQIVCGNENGYSLSMGNLLQETE